MYSLFRFLVIFLFSLTLSSCNHEEPEFPSFVKHIKLSANPLPLAEKTVAELNRHLKAVENGSETINDYPYIAAVILIGALENKNEDLLLEEIKQLVFFGCDIKTQDTSGAMALHYAALGGYEEISSYLQKNGLCLDAIDNLGLTPLMYALMGRADIKLEEWLCSGSRNLCQKDKMGNSLAHYAAQGGRVNMLLYLKENGVDILAHNNQGVSTVMAASYGGNLECIKFLQTEGSNMLHCASDGVNSIMYAAWGGSIDALKYCLSLGLELESVDSSGSSVVHHAAFGGHVSILRFLVQKNVDISRPNKDGLTAFVITAMAGNWTAMNYIYSNAHVSKAELLQAHQYALQYGHEECAKKIRLWLTEDTSK